MPSSRQLLALTLCAAALGAALGVASCRNGGTGQATSETTDTNTVERTNGIAYIELSGTHAEMGRQHGKLLKKDIRAQIADYRKQVHKIYGEENGDKILRYAVGTDSGFLKDVKRHTPHLYEEMVGIAEGAGVPVNDVLLINMYEEVYEGAPVALGIKPLAPDGKCTTVSCSGRKDRPNLNAQNLDYTPNLDGAQLMIHFTYPNGLKVLMYTFAGQVGGIGANSKGLSMLCNTLPEGSKRDKPDGLGGTYITRRLLEQDSVAGAIAWLRGKPQFGSYNYSLADFKEAAMVEFSPKGLERLDVPKGGHHLAHANHLLKLDDRNEVLPEFPKGRPTKDAVGRTLDRQATADKHWGTKAKTATVDDLKAFLTAPPVNREGADWMTLQSIIVTHEKGNMQVFASAGCKPGRGWNIYRFK